MGTTTRTANPPASDRTAAGRKTMLVGHLPLHPRQFATQDVAVPKPRPVEPIEGNQTHRHFDGVAVARLGKTVGDPTRLVPAP